MALATQCPHCSTIFRVAHDQLKLRGGIVRCGKCGEVFDGNAALVDASLIPAPEVSPAPPASAFGTAFDAEVAQIDARATAGAADELPVYTLDFDTAFDPLGILPKPAAPETKPMPATDGAPRFDFLPADEDEDASENANALARPRARDAADAEDAPTFTPTSPDELPPSAPGRPDTRTDVHAEADANAAADAPTRGASTRDDDSAADADDDHDTAAHNAAAEPEIDLDLDFDVDIEDLPASTAPPAYAAEMSSAPLPLAHAKLELDLDVAADLGANVVAEEASTYQAIFSAAGVETGPTDQPITGTLSRRLADKLRRAAAEQAGASSAGAPAAASSAAPVAGQNSDAAASSASLHGTADASDAEASANAATASDDREARKEPSFADTLDAVSTRRVEPVFHFDENEERAIHALPEELDVEHNLDDDTVTLSSAAAGAAALGAAALADSADADTDAKPDEEPGFITRMRQAQRWGKAWRIAMGIGSALLLVALLAQTVTNFRNTLAAQFPPLQPALASACSVLGCRVELPSQIENLTIDVGELQNLGGNAYSLITAMRNQSSLTQAWPDIELILNDADNKPLARRVFAPRDYLAPVQNPATGFAPRSEHAVKLYFDLSQLKASGYNIAVFYP